MRKTLTNQYPHSVYDLTKKNKMKASVLVKKKKEKKDLVVDVLHIIQERNKK